MPTTLASSYDMTCRGCGKTMRVLTCPEEASLRAAEFAREHASHYRVRVDQNGIAVEPIGVTYPNEGRHRGSAEG